MNALTTEKVAQRLKDELGFRFRRDRDYLAGFPKSATGDLFAILERDSTEDYLRAQIRVDAANKAGHHLEEEGAGIASLKSYVLFAISEATMRGRGSPFLDWKAAEKVKAQLEIAGLFGAYLDTDERQPEGSPSYGAGDDEPTTESRRQCHFIAQAEYLGGARKDQEPFWNDVRQRRDTKEEAERDLEAIQEQAKESPFYTGRTRVISRSVHIVESVLISKGGEA